MFPYLLTCKILWLEELILMLHCVLQIEHHPTFRIGNYMYYVIYLRQIVNRVYFCENIVLLQPYLNCGENEIIPAYYIYSGGHHELAPNSILLWLWPDITISDWSPFQVRYQINKIYSHQSFTPWRCRSHLGHHSGIVFCALTTLRSVVYLQTNNSMNANYLPLHITNFVYMLTSIERDSY